MNFQNDVDNIVLRKVRKETEVKVDGYEKNKEKGDVVVFQANFVKKIRKMTFGYTNDKDLVKDMKTNEILIFQGMIRGKY